MKFVVFQSEQNGQWYWHLLADNNEKIAVGGEGYHNKKDALHDIDLVKSTTASTTTTIQN